MQSRKSRKLRSLLADRRSQIRLSFRAIVMRLRFSYIAKSRFARSSNAEFAKFKLRFETDLFALYYAKSGLFFCVLFLDFVMSNREFYVGFFPVSSVMKF